MKFYWGINSNFGKRFTEQKNCSANFSQQGEACAVPFTFLIVCMQTSRKRRDPAHCWTSASLHGDHLKSDQLEAVNRGEEYLRETFEFHGALIHLVSYCTCCVVMNCFLINNVQLLERSFYLCCYYREVTQEIITGVIPLRDPQRTKITLV